MVTSEDHSSEQYNPDHSQTGTTQKEYAPEDFSQLAINRGQRKINYALTVVDEKLAKAMELLRNAIAATPAGHDIDFDAFDQAISDVYRTSRRVASIKPPGCDPIWEPPEPS
jgi:hypothetical protein